MKILLLGATGFIGAQIKTELEALSYSLICPSREGGFDFTNLLNSEDWSSVLTADIDVVINAVGIIAETKTSRFESVHSLAPIALFEACEKLSISRVIQISALGADETAFSKYHLSKKKADDYLRQSNLDYFILRPSLVYGKESDSTKLLSQLARLPLSPVINNGISKIQPIYEKDLIKTVVVGLKAKPSKVIDVVGPDEVTFREYLCLLKGSDIRAVNFPEKIALQLSRIGEFINSAINSESIKMLLRGNTADVSGLINFLGYSPQSLKEVI